MPRSLLLFLLSLACVGCATSRGGGVLATPEPYAAREGARVLREGGNAVDAAVCVGFVLAVTHPYAGNLGGGGFMVVHTKKGDAVIDAREVAPRAATRDMYLDSDGNVRPEASLVGPLAAGVPGSVHGYLELLEKYGTMDREELLEPAIRLAEDGFRVDQGLHDALQRHRKLLSRFPETARIFLPEGRVPEVGEELKQPELARVLRAIAEYGRKGFYEGWFANAVQAANKKHGGLITVGDLYTYKSKMRKPVRGTYRGYTVLTMPPPSSGGVVLLQMLDMIDRANWDTMRPEQRTHLFAEVSRRAFADRAEYFGDPDFEDVPIQKLLDKEYLATRFGTISMARATKSIDIRPGLAGPRESEETCHFSVLDKDGNAVSCTTTLNGAFGCGLAVSGVLLNNEMDDFTSKPGAPNQFGLIQGEKNDIEAGKRPLSSMTPTILLKDGEVFLVLGSPGGPTIISTVCQVIARHVGAGMSLSDAVDAPRIHCQWMPDEIVHEPLPDARTQSLRDLGHSLRERRRIGDVQAVGRTPEGRLIGVTDKRGRGAVAVAK